MAPERPPEPQRHLIYLHGRIVQEEQSARPRHPQHGDYELEAIVSAFRDRGFAVESEIRPKGTTVEGGADRLVEKVRSLLQSGVEPHRITIVGASMGASIALRASARLNNPELRFAVLGPCLSRSFSAIAAEEGSPPAGRILVIRDRSDVPDADCPAAAESAEAKEIVIDTGRGHGFLYRPMAEWVEPVAEWAR
jgi:dienelactone hydrolase